MYMYMYIMQQYYMNGNPMLLPQTVSTLGSSDILITATPSLIVNN